MDIGLRGLMLEHVRIYCPSGRLLIIFSTPCQRLAAVQSGSKNPRRLPVFVGAQFICAMGGWAPPLQSPSDTWLQDGYRAVGFFKTTNTFKRPRAVLSIFSSVQD